MRCPLTCDVFLHSAHYNNKLQMIFINRTWISATAVYRLTTRTQIKLTESTSIVAFVGAFSARIFNAFCPRRQPHRPCDS